MPFLPPVTPHLLSYRETPQRSLRMHIFTPQPSTEDTQTLVFSRGRLANSSPDLVYFIARRFAAAGYRAVLPEYRLGERDGTGLKKPRMMHWQR